MNKYKKTILLVISLLIISNITVNNLSASGASPPTIMPSIITVNNVLKGTEFGHELIIENVDSVDHIVNISFIGEIESWVSFHKLTDRITPVSSMPISKNSYEFLYLKITVPEDAPNGTYYGNISAVYEDVEQSVNGVIVRPTQKAPVRIEVTGEQIINMSVERIIVNDAEIGFPVVCQVDCKNSGNVPINSFSFINMLTIDIEFFIENNFVGNITKSGRELDSISPGQTRTYNIYWDTSKLVLLGNYSAFFNISLNEDIIKSESIVFKIIKEGTLERSGTLDDLSFGQQPKKGTDAVLIANFTNNGKIEIKAQFNATVFLDGNILYKFTSQEARVPVYSQANFESFIPIEEDGEYIVVGYVYYSDTKDIVEGTTENKEIKFTIGGASLLDFDNIYLKILIVIVGIIFVIIIMFVKSNKKLSDENKKSKKTSDKAELQKSKINKTPQRRIRIARNKEKSPFKTKKEDKKKKDEKILKEIEEKVESLKKNDRAQKKSK